MSIPISGKNSQQATNVEKLPQPKKLYLSKTQTAKLMMKQ